MASHHWSFDDGPDWHDSPGDAVAPAATVDATGGADARSPTGDPLPFVSGRQFTGLDLIALGRPLVLDADIRSEFAGSFTVAFWCRTTAHGTADAAAAPAVVGSSRFAVGALDAQGRIGVVSGAGWAAVSRRAINDGQWHFVSITRHAVTGRIAVAVDGGEASLGAVRSGRPVAPVHALGGRTGGDAVFPGQLDQVSLFATRLATSALALVRTNHAPKTWAVTADGTIDRELRTPSVLLSAYDVEGDRLRVVRFDQPTHGRARHRGDGSFAITPDPGFVGHDRMHVVLADGRGGYSRAAIEFDVLREPPTGIRASAFVAFAPVVAGDAPLRTASPWRVPRAVDVDRDGRLDLLVAADAALTYYRNIGEGGRAVFAAGVPVHAGGVPIQTADAAAFAIADMTGDGRPDVVLSDSTGTLLVFADMSGGGGVITFAAGVPLVDEHGDPVVPPDPRLDVGDYDDDGLPDLVVGTFAGDLRLFVNRGTVSTPAIAHEGVTLTSGAYNLFPRVIDLSRNGVPDLLLGVNWGTVTSWLDPALRGGRLDDARAGRLSITDAAGIEPDLHALTDGPVVDVADIDGDGVVDLLIGGQLAGDTIFVARGTATSIEAELDFLGSVLRDHPRGLGPALDAEGGLLLARVRASFGRIVSIVTSAAPGERAALWSRFAAHVRGCSQLRMRRPVNVATEHHLPSIIAQYAIIAGHILPDTSGQRAAIADLFGMEGLRRRLYVDYRLVVGDNVRASAGQLATLLEFMKHQPRASFPDDIITIDQFFGDGRGGLVATPSGGKNVFGDATGTSSDEWPDDVRTALAAARPGNPTAGDLFTFVVGHEVTHSLDAYVRSRRNADLARRWGQMLCLAAGDDVVAGADGWIDWAATQARFADRGLWDGDFDTWAAAWEAYWSTGRGGTLNESSFLRGGISWFLENPQESLATQANQHWVDAEGRLLGAVARFHRGITPPLTEALTFLDFVSVGLNRVAMYDIDPDPVRGRAVWKLAFADLSRDDRGFIDAIRMSDSGRTYRFTVDASGVYRDVTVHGPGEARAAGRLP